MVSRPAGGGVWGDSAGRGGREWPHSVAPDKLRQEVWGGVGEGSFLPTLMHLVLFLPSPLARQPQGYPLPPPGKQGGWARWRSELQGGAMRMMMGRKDNNNDSLNMRESVSSLAPETEDPGSGWSSPGKLEELCAWDRFPIGRTLHLCWRGRRRTSRGLTPCATWAEAPAGPFSSAGSGSAVLTSQTCEEESGS